MMKCKQKVLFENIGLLIYKICLDIIYVNFVCNEFGYYITNKVEFELLHYLESWLLLFVLIVFRPKRKSITAYYLHIQLAVMVIPMLTVYGLSYRSRYFMCLIVFVHCVQCILECIIKVKTKHRTSIKQGVAINKVIILLVTCGTLLFTIMKFGIPDFRALNNDNVYSVRDENELTGIFAYIVNWFFSVAFPITLVYGMKKGKKSNIFLFGAFAMFLYLTYAHKTWFLSAFFVVAVYIVTKYNLFTMACCVGLPVMVSFCMLCYKISEKLLLVPSMFVRRLLIVPADIKFQYFDFFKEREKLHFSEGVFGKIFGIEYVYDKKIVYVIGEQMGTPNDACNTGYLADAFANAGTIGVIGFALLLFVILKALDIFLCQEDFVINFSVLSYSLYSLNDTALLTRLLTGGLALLIVVLVLNKRAKCEHACSNVSTG